MEKRRRMEQFLSRQEYTYGVPAAFFQHFGPSQRHGDEAVEAQLRFYRATDMDIMKIMFDDIYPKFTVTKAEDWRRVPEIGIGDPVFQRQLEVVKRLVDAVGKEAYVFATLFAPFVSAGCAVSPVPAWDSLVTPHFLEDPQAMTQGLTRIAAQLCEFGAELAKAGVDGFYVSLQGGERDRYSPEFFEEWFKPMDLLLLRGLAETGKKVMLHICGTNIRLSSYFDYPGDVVNMACADNQVPLLQAREEFGRPVLGGIPNHGVIVEGSRREVEAAVREALDIDIRGVMLGADCTIPRDVSPERLRWAVDAAHGIGRGGKPWKP